MSLSPRSPSVPVCSRGAGTPKKGGSSFHSWPPPLLFSFLFANTQGVLLPAAFWDPVGQDLTSDSSFRVPRARNVILEIKRSTHSESKSPLRCLLKRLPKAKCLQLSHFGKMLASGFGG